MDLKSIAILSSLLGVEGIGPRLLLKLINRFTSPEEILTASINDLVQLSGISENIAKRISLTKLNFPPNFDSFNKEYERLTRIGGNIITFFDDGYPEKLFNTYSPPIILYYLGDISILNSDSIAIVGTRRPSRYGIKQAEVFAELLSSNGLTIVSGLARGIDSAAHRACLKANGKTIAVIGSGLDWIYPPENKGLFHEIANKGLVVSEFKFGTKPDAKNFPQRNRIIAGLTLGTLVVETKASGGALNTAAHALNEGREVFAIPGNIGVSTSEGANILIQKGEAKITLKVSDILEELNLSISPAGTERKAQVDISQLNLFEQKIFESLSTTPQHIDSIADKSGLSVVDCSIHLLSMEFKGIVEQLPGKYFVKV